jgi:hypothetical protein
VKTLIMVAPTGRHHLFHVRASAPPRAARQALARCS